MAGKCPHCGHDLDPMAKRCYNCGFERNYDFGNLGCAGGCFAIAGGLLAGFSVICFVGRNFILSGVLFVLTILCFVLAVKKG